MGDPSSIPPPNYTQIPNAIFELMADKEARMTEAELRVVLAIARKTFGWHKKRDKLSLTQLETLTAMSRPSVKAGIDAAIARGLVRRTPDRKDTRGGFYYELMVEEPNESTSKKSLLVKNLNQLNILTDTSKDFLPELVKNLYPQKKDKEKKETSSPTGDDDGDFIRELLQAFNISETMARKIAHTGADLDTVLVSIRNNYDPKDDRTMGRILKRLVAAPPETGKPYAGPFAKKTNGVQPSQLADAPDQQTGSKTLGTLARKHRGTL